MYENTGFQRYLDAARRMATFFRDSMPSDGIVPWLVLPTRIQWIPGSNIFISRDFNAPLSPPRPADSSATTVAANGLLLLSKLEHSRSNFTGSSLWTNFAIQVCSAGRFNALWFANDALSCLIAPGQSHKTRLETRVAESSLERDRQQPSQSTEQFDWYSLW